LAGELKGEICVILCEGDGDSAFFRHLIKKRNLPTFAVITPTRPQPGGRSGYQARLESLRLESQFEEVRGIIVVSDNDDSPSKSFSEVIGHIKRATGYGIPKRPLQIVKPQKRDHPLLSVMMVPWTRMKGNLESLCLLSMYDCHPEIKKCLDAFCRCLRINSWTKGKLSKMKLRTMVAAACKSDPNTSLQYSWSRTEELIPLEHTCFDKIANFLVKFSRSVKAP
jgi:hypothetical protein